MPRPKLLRPSIFTKLILLLFFTWLATNLLLSFLFKQIALSPHQQTIHRAVIGYMDYLIKDLGYPPSFEKALDISRQMDIEINYDGSGISWSTDQEIFRRLKHFTHIKDGIREFDTGFSHGRLYVSQKTDHGRFTIATNIKPIFHALEKRLFLSSLLLLFLILAGVYLSIRWIMKPVKFLSKGAEEIGRGNLEYKIPLQRSDELGDLVKTFNSMIERIQDQIKTKEQLLLDVSHELRSPITRMKVALELLPESENRQKLQDDLHEMEVMVTELLETARLERDEESLTRSPIHVYNLLEEIKQFYRSLAPDLKIISEHKNNMIQGDIRQIKTVLTNIINNAIKYSGEIARPVEIEEKREDETLVIKIRDQGPGIPKEDLPFIFEPFFRVDKSRSKKTGGYGLGLSLCKKIMEAHKGDISIESEVGKGTTVILSFPSRQE